MNILLYLKLVDVALYCFVYLSASIVSFMLYKVTNPVMFSLLLQLSRGKSRSETILFSSKAVICQHGGRLSLMLRLGDIRRRSQIVGASVHMLLLQRHQTDYGEDLPCHQRYLSVQTEYEDNFFFLAWPFKVSQRRPSSSLPGPSRWVSDVHLLIDEDV